jgi:rod shape-determining protein MreC
VLSLIKRYRELLVVSALLLYPFATFLARGGGTRDPNLVDRALIAISGPVQRAFGWTIDAAGAAWRSYVNLRGVKEENDRLRQDNTHLSARVHALSEVQIENERLRRLLGYAARATGQEVPARVIAINPVPHPFSLRIDRGSDHGVRPGTAVIAADGVVGQVIRATGGYADVMTVKDPNSRTSVRVQRSRARATAAGVGGDKNLVLENLLRTEDVKEGDLIITAGTDGVFPPGLAVGNASAVARKTIGMFQTAEVIPAVDMTKVEEVLVLPQVDVPANPPTATVPVQKEARP